MMEDIDQDPQVSAAYTTKLDQTLQDLQDRVKEQEALLEKLRATTSVPISEGPSQDPKTHLHQLLTLKEAYDSLTTPPYLPPPKSVLPALLAYRTTSSCIQETQECITTTSHDLTRTLSQLQEEQTSHKDALAIQTSLQNRIQTLTTTLQTQTLQTPTQIATSLKSSLQTAKKHYDTETIKLIQAFNTFIITHLAPMLAAEELGGPIVGQMLTITPEHLTTGFSSQGKPKKPRSNQTQTQTLEKNQRRIDEIWGPAPLSSSPSAPSSQQEAEKEPRTEQTAAATEIRALAEQLLNNLLEASENGTGGYVKLDRDSAAARFLVRSKVAQYHFRDARMLRLVDFGRDIV